MNRGERNTNTKPYENQDEEKNKLKAGDDVIFRESRNDSTVYAGHVIAVDREANTIVICTDINCHTLYDFRINKIILCSLAKS